jgi:hypothetical protein
LNPHFSYGWIENRDAVGIFADPPYNPAEGGSMLYIGHFSVDEYDDGDQRRHGYFTAVTDAPDADQSVARFKTLITRLKDSHEAFGRVAAVYIEDIIEFRRDPEEALITRYQSSEGEFPKSISHSLPGFQGNDVAAYGYAPDVGSREGATSERYTESTPFLRFE